MREEDDSDQMVVHTVPLLTAALSAGSGNLTRAGSISAADTGITVTVRDTGAAVYVLPDLDAARLGTLAAGSLVAVLAVRLESASAWLQIAWTASVVSGSDDTAWIAGEDTDFTRSRAFERVVDQWYETDSVLGIRRTLVQDLLRVKKSSDDEIAAVDTLAGTDLVTQEDALAQGAVVSGYQAFWALNEHLGLPDPFDYLPVQPMPPAAAAELLIDGFGPTTTAQDQGDVYYTATRGMSSGLEYPAPEGSPLIAVADGVIVDFTFLEHPAAHSLALRPYLPDRFRAADGARVLSNVIVAYGHLTSNPPTDLVQVGDVVRAGQVIGASGWPVYTRSDGSLGVQGNNAHLALEIHLVTDGVARLGDVMPLNPILFWSPRMVALQARFSTLNGRRSYPRSHARYGRLGFFSLGAFGTDYTDSVWSYASTTQLWPDAVYTLDALVTWARTLPAYPLDGSGPV